MLAANEFIAYVILLDMASKTAVSFVAIILLIHQ